MTRAIWMRAIVLTALGATVVVAGAAERGGASTPRPYNVRPTGPGGQRKMIHPHALKLILQGRNEDAVAYLQGPSGRVVDAEHTKLLLATARGEAGAWRFDAESWPWPRSLPRTDLKREAPADRFTIAFGGGAGYDSAENERMWVTIRKLDPRAMLLLGDNVYSDDPETPAVQRFEYYRRQSQPDWRKLVERVPVYAIWDDHDFSTNDSWGGPHPDKPAWKREVWWLFKEQWANPYYGGGEEHPGVWFDFRIGGVHFIMLDGRYYREDPSLKRPSMLGPAQMQWLERTLGAGDATFTVIASPVPWAEGVKPGSKDTWDGYAEERERIFRKIADKQIDGVVLLSADRHRSDAYKIDRPGAGAYDLYEFSSSRLTNDHKHELMKHALFGYNAKCSVGLLEFDTAADDPTVTYKIVSVDGEVVHELTIKRSQITAGDR